MGNLSLTFFSVISLLQLAAFLSSAETIDASIDQAKELISLDPERFKWADSVFEAKCAFCHEKDGRGEGEPQRNLVDGIWNHGGTLVEIENTIRDGVSDTLTVLKNSLEFLLLRNTKSWVVGCCSSASARAASI